jgi:DnaJ like chaperone protein
MTTNDTSEPSDGRGYGKLAGAFLLGVAGAMTLGWQGAVAGLVIGLTLGHWFDVRVSATYDDPEQPRPQASYEVDQEAQRLFAEEIAGAFAGLVRALGRSPSAAEGSLWIYLRDRLGFEEEQIAAAAQSLKAALHRDSNLAEACERCARALPDNEHRLLVSALYELARDIGASAGPTRMAMRDAAQALGVSEEDEASLRALVFGAGDQSHDYALLGVEETASDSDVKSAFRKLASRLHPDRVSHLGEKAVEMATVEFGQVRTAYERIRSARGF